MAQKVKFLMTFTSYTTYNLSFRFKLSHSPKFPDFILSSFQNLNKKDAIQPATIYCLEPPPKQPTN